MKKFTKALLLAGTAVSLFFASCSTPLIDPNTVQAGGKKLVNLNPDPFGEPWLAGGMPVPTEASRAVGDSAPAYAPELVLTTLPTRVDNSANQFFRPIFNQADGSCAQASGVGYLYTYELNRLRGVAANTEQTQYPTHFTYNYLNDGSGNNGSWYWDGWNIIKEMGVPNVPTYGGMFSDPSSWKNGYGIYRQAMNQHLGSYSRLDVSTPAGLNNLKQWLAHHGDGSPEGGLAVFAAGAVSTYNDPTYPNTKLLAAGQPEAGKWVIVKWGTTMNHAMTFVGYDDGIMYDYNGDGQYTNDKDINGDGVVNMKDWEIGALIVVNSWGNSWGNSGRSYMMYKLLAEYQAYTGNGGVYNNEVWLINTINSTYTPKASLKVTYTYNKRGRLSFTLGINPDVTATSPSLTKVITAFNYRGSDIPVAGTGTSGPVEVGFDMTSLVSQLTTPAGTPYRVFFNVTENDYDASGSGYLNSVQFIDHTNFDKSYTSSITNAAIPQNGGILVAINKDDRLKGAYATMNLRGTFNSWGATPMKLTANNVWTGVITFAADTGNNFKFDVSGDWKTNWGDNNGDYYGDVNGLNIPVTQGAGEYTITFNDLTRNYSIIKTRLSGSADFYWHLNGSVDYAALVGQKTKLTLNGQLLSEPLIDSPYYGSNGLPILFLSNLDAGNYVLTLDNVLNGLVYKYSYAFTLSPTNKSISVTAEVQVTTQQVVLKKTYPQMYLRGSFNGWGTTAMTLSSDYTWSYNLTAPAGGNTEIKFDVYGDWKTNFGDTNKDGWADAGGSNIVLAGGKSYKVQFNDSTKAWSATAY